MISLNLSYEDCENGAAFMERYLLTDIEDCESVNYVLSLVRILNELKNAPKRERGQAE